MTRRPWGWSLSHPPSFDFNNVSVLKSFLYHRDGEATLQELKSALRQELKRDYTDRELEEIYLRPLYLQPHLFSTEGELVILHMDSVPENDEAEAVLDRVREPLTMAEIRKEVAKGLSTSEKHVVLTLDRDHRFVQARGPRATYYGLTRWHFVNDFAYRLLSRSSRVFRRAEEISIVLEREIGAADPDAVFWPKVDARFIKKGIRWGLKEWQESSQLKSSDIARPLASRQFADVAPPVHPVKLAPPVGRLPEVVEQEELAPVSAEIRSQIKDKATAFQAYCRRLGHSVEPTGLLQDVMDVDAYHSSYRAYQTAVREHLGASSDWVQAGQLRWILKEMLPKSLHLPRIHTGPRVRRPAIDFAYDEIGPEKIPEFGSSTTGEQESNQGDRIRLVLTYPHLVNGSVLIPRARRGLFPVVEWHLLEVRLKDEYYRDIAAWYERSTGVIHGLGEWYQQEKVEPGSIFTIERAHGDETYLLSHTGEVDELRKMDQSRFARLEEARRKAQEVNLPFYAILMNVLAEYPEGLRYREIWQLVNAIRPVAISTVITLLSQLPCFIQLDKRPGIWQYDPIVRQEALRMLHRPIRRKGEQKTSVTWALADNQPSGTKLEPQALMEAEPKAQERPKPDQQPEPDVQPQLRDGLSRPEPLPTTVKGRVAWLIEHHPKLVHSDKELIAAYLRQFHNLDLVPTFLDPTTPAPETIRRARQKLEEIRDKGRTRKVAPESVAGRVWTILQEMQGSSDSQVQAFYYRRYHQLDSGIDQPGIPPLETIRRSRQELVGKLRESRQPKLSDEVEEEFHGGFENATENHVNWHEPSQAVVDEPQSDSNALCSAGRPETRDPHSLPCLTPTRVTRRPEAVETTCPSSDRAKSVDYEGRDLQLVSGAADIEERRYRLRRHKNKDQSKGQCASFWPNIIRHWWDFVLRKVFQRSGRSFPMG